MAVIWTDTPLIKKITLPSGNTYFIADREGREKIEQLYETISGGVSFVIAWDGASVPVVANIPAGIKVVYQGTTYTGTLDADDAQPGAFYLIKSSTQTSEGTADVYDEYVPVGESGIKAWEKIGDTQVDLKDVVMGVTLNKQTDVALGEATTFALTSGSVTFGTPTTDTFVKSVSAETNKNLVTTSITPIGSTTSVTGVQSSTTSVTGVQATTTTASKASAASASKATVGTSQTTVKSFTSTTGSEYDPSTDLLQGATVANEILTIGSVAPDTQTTTQYTFSDVNFSDVTVPIKNTSATTVPIKDTSSTTVPVAGTAVTVATGATSTTGTGDAVVTGVTIGSSASAITALPTASVGTGITVGTNDKVNVLTNATDITVTKGQ